LLNLDNVIVDTDFASLSFRGEYPGRSSDPGNFVFNMNTVERNERIDSNPKARGKKESSGSFVSALGGAFKRGDSHRNSAQNGSNKDKGIEL